jgi:transporter family protein
VPRWLFWSLLTIAAWGIWGVLGKALGDLSAAQSQAFSTVGILPVMAVLAALPGWRGGGGRSARGGAYAFAAGVLVGLGNLAYYQALSVGAKAATAVALTALYPVVTVVLALFLLGEKPLPVQWLGVAGALAAVLLLNVAQPPGSPTGWVAYVLAPVALWGVAALVMKLSTREATAEQATFWFLAAFAPLGLAIIAIEPVPWALPARDWLVVALLGATYGVGNLALLAAYRHGGKASVVTPLSGLYPVVTIPLAIVFFGEHVGVREWSGIALALVAAIALAYDQPTTAAAEVGETNDVGTPCATAP